MTEKEKAVLKRLKPKGLSQEKKRKFAYSAAVSTSNF